jgi:hypothetical protein
MNSTQVGICVFFLNCTILAGGGVYSMEWTSNFVKTWFFPRNSIPDDIARGKPDPTQWKTPLALFTGDCDFDKQFYDQKVQIV